MTAAAETVLFDKVGRLVNPEHEAELRVEMVKAFQYGLEQGRAEGKREALLATKQG